jgi:hypothetical protein
MVRNSITTGIYDGWEANGFKPVRTAIIIPETIAHTLILIVYHYYVANRYS